MKRLIPLIVILLSTINLYSQTCSEVMEYVKSKSYGTTYTSFTSDAISKVTFYEISIDYQTYYFAIVCFKRKYSLDCTEYIYQVGSNTKHYYSLNYMFSAGKAFWKYIQPYNKHLGCGPDL